GGSAICTVTYSVAGSHAITAAYTGSSTRTPSNSSVLTQVVQVPIFTLSVSKIGLGQGTVTTNDGKIDCGSTCNTTYAEGSGATLQAAPDGNSTFASWVGGNACPGSGNPTCGVVFASDIMATARFDPLPRALLGAAIRRPQGPAGVFDF